MRLIKVASLGMIGFFCMSIPAGGCSEAPSENVQDASLWTDVVSTPDGSAPVDGAASDARADARADAPLDGGAVRDAGADTGKADASGDGGVPGPGPVQVLTGPSGVTGIIAGGVNLFGGNGGYYVIGSCTGADDPGQNVTSVGANGSILHAPGTCPGAPYSISVVKESDIRFRMKVRVGPLPVAYKSLSVPLDPTKRAITSLRASASSFTVGCGDGWTPRAGGEILFADIPTPCEIPGYGFVGAARFSPPPVWGEITGPYGTMRRTMVTGAATELLFYNHPGTNNIELGFNLDSGAPLAAGTTVTLEELLEVTPPAGGYLTRSQVLLPLVYQAVLGRAPDASGAATFGPIVASGAAGMESAASSMYGSAEFAARRASLSAEEVVHQFYVGLLGRRADPAGLAGKVPLVQSGQYAALFHALVTSNEFRIAFPLAYAP